MNRWFSGYSDKERTGSGKIAGGRTSEIQRKPDGFNLTIFSAQGILPAMAAVDLLPGIDLCELS
jgi:hypothetical protein